MAKKNFGRQLIEARESKGLNSAQLAQELKVSANAVHKWENGLSFPRPDKWQDILRVTGLDPQKFKSDKTTYELPPGVSKDELLRELEAMRTLAAIWNVPLDQSQSVKQPTSFRRPTWQEQPKPQETEIFTPIHRQFENDSNKPSETDSDTLSLHSQNDNKHMSDLVAWISQQHEPEIYWAELKRHLMSIEPEFKDFVQNRS